MPIVAASIHWRASSLFDVYEPIKNPMIAVVAERKFHNNARQCEKPDCSKTA